MGKRQSWENGAILKIKMNDECFCYGQMLTHENCEMAFYDSRTTKAFELSEITNLPVLFRVAVHKSAYNTGRWQKIGKAEIPEDLLEPRETYIEDKISGKYQIYKLGQIRPARKEECIGLECCAVWDPNHVEDRLNDFYEGRQCIWCDEFWRTESR